MAGIQRTGGPRPHVVLEHRNFVKKLVFPLETLPVNQVVAGLVTELFALGVFLVMLLILRGAIPATVFWLPVLLVPQLLFTLGLCWFLAAMGAYMRDLGQIIGFVLTLWFFITPICYPDTNLPHQRCSCWARIRSTSWCAAIARSCWSITPPN